ncbi:arginine--tRNA ligase [Bauldia sp.]|uniref:arginine--tRNA ligase n=1 Tax=Bauldia sp. TaxID=2575872 RepID=UPI003BAABEB8
MTIFKDFTRRLTAAAQSIAADAGMADLDTSRLVVEPPRDPDHGDLASNAAMVLAKPLRAKPRELAERLAAALADDPDIETVDVAGPGFINLRLTDAYWHGTLAALLAAGKAFGRSEIGAGEKVNVEYVSANPTGPMHIGHCRGAVVGDALANLLDAAGYAVTREYYINDAGAQVDVLARSVYLRYREALGEVIGAIPEGLYPGDYLKPVGAALAAEYGETLRDMAEPAWLPIVRAATIDAMMAIIRDDLATLSISHEVFFSERSLTTGDPNAIETAIAGLAERGLVYQGRLPPPKGKLPDDWEDREQTLFRATEFGDDIDRPLKKSDGSPTYLAADIAYHADKLRRGFQHMIDVVGADHGGYVKRISAAVRAVGGDDVDFEIKLVQIVRLMQGGEQIKMSKRAGDFVTVRDLVDEVGPDPIRFMMVFRKNDAQLDFDFDTVTEQSKDNPVFYVQYAYARTCSVFRQASSEVPDLDASPTALAGADLSALVDEGEIALVRRLAEYPRVVEASAEAREPHRIAFYLHELASDFHAHWNRGKELPQLRFINQTDSESTLARLALVHAINLVLSSGLAILGVRAPEEMR